jgi:chromosomal replication initiation ATPase DnaA
VPPLDQIWDDIRQELQRETPDFKFQIWIEPLELAGVDGKTLYVRAPEHIRTSVADRYLPLLRRAAARCFDRHAVVQVVGAGWVPPSPAERAGPPAPPPEAGRLMPKYTFEQFVIGEAPAPRDRQLRPALRCRAASALRDERGVHDPVRGGRPQQAHR